MSMLYRFLLLSPDLLLEKNFPRKVLLIQSEIVIEGINFDGTPYGFNIDSPQLRISSVTVTAVTYGQGQRPP